MEKSEMLVQAGLNWNVRTEGIQTMSGIVIPDKICNIRDDNNSPLGIVSNDYHNYQNEQLLELLYQITAKTGLELHSGGSFGGGKRVWLQLKSNDLILPGDKVEGYISGFNSFDGSTSLAFGNSNKTVSCENTFWMAYRSVDSKLRHSSQMIIRIEMILQNIDLLLKEEKNTFEKIKRLGEVKMSEEVKQMVVDLMFDLKKQEQLDTEYSTRKTNSMNRFFVDLNGELKTKEDSLWGLFSGVTKYTTHSMKKTDNTENKIFGVVGNKERLIFNKLVELTEPA
jgi:phage/plasmid-like protein (TIGR03299 family)